MNDSFKFAAQNANVDAVELDEAALEAVTGGDCTYDGRLFSTGATHHGQECLADGTWRTL